MKRAPDQIAEFLAQLRRELPANAPLKRRLLKECQEHLEDAVTALMEAGVPRTEAERTAIKRFGSPKAVAHQMGYPSRSGSGTVPGGGAPDPRPKDRPSRVALGGAGERAREFVPLTTVVIALALALLVFPSNLMVPNPEPGETLEYAPIPPDETEEPPPPDANLSALSLADSSGVSGDGTGGSGGGLGPAGGGGPGPLGLGANPSSKRCVGKPPRQTEDPESPPCVAFFRGDNFGATHPGVTGDEVRLLVYLSGGFIPYASSQPTRETPRATYFDLFSPPSEDEPFYVKGLRGWQRYFNDRFQTYGRIVHFFVYFDSGTSPEQRRADAAANFARVKPFAVVTAIPFGGNEVVYVEEMARRGVLNFGSLSAKQAGFFQRFPKLIWGHDATVEYQSELFSTYVCQKIVGRPVAISGNVEQGLGNGSPRRLGILHTTDTRHPGLVHLAEMVRAKVEACGGDIVATATFPRCCYVSPESEPGAPSVNMAEFREAGVTTVLWPGGIDGDHAHAAFQMGYLPEWFLLGTGGLDGTDGTRLARNGAAFDGRAVVITPEVLYPAFPQQLCYQAYREADGEMPPNDVAYMCGLYRLLFEVFVGVQVAGPRLTPDSIDKGFHAIPHVESKNPQTPACFYLPGDYTCVKDAQFEIWDNDSLAPGDNRPGCWRVFRDAARYFPGEWPPGNIDSELQHVGPCNGFLPLT